MNKCCLRGLEQITLTNWVHWEVRGTHDTYTYICAWLVGPSQDGNSDAINLGLEYVPPHIRFPIEQRFGLVINCSAVVRFIEGSSRLKGSAKALDVFRLETKIEAPKLLNLKSQLNPKHPETMLVPECVVKGSCFLSWGSGGGGVFAGRFRAAGL